MRTYRWLAGAASIAAVMLAPCAAAEDGPLADAILGGALLADLRLRYEHVEQENKALDADALTLRARLGYRTGEFHGFAALADADVIQHLGPEHFFDTTAHGFSSYPAVADPDMATLNRLQLTYTASLSSGSNPIGLTITAGRQRIILDDARFVGNAGWRQHEQTYDAASAGLRFDDASFTYAYIARVNRVFGPQSPADSFGSDSHVVHLEVRAVPQLKLIGFAYLLDLEEAPVLSTATYGMRAEGTFDLGAEWKANLNGTYARQAGYGRNPSHIDLANVLGEAGLTFKGWSGLIGYEVLEGNGTVGFQTPLATLHAFQGWAEAFLTKPPKGLEDLYVKARCTFALEPASSAVTAALVYHDFSAQHVDADYGSEWDAMIEAKLDHGFGVGSAFAGYHGAGPFPSKRVLWFYATYVY